MGVNKFSILCSEYFEFLLIHSNIQNKDIPNPFQESIVKTVNVNVKKLKSLLIKAIRLDGCLAKIMSEKIHEGKPSVQANEEK